jgi:hypothetical protein
MIQTLQGKLQINLFDLFLLKLRNLVGILGMDYCVCVDFVTLSLF